MLTIEEDLPGVFVIGTAEDLHQSGFPCSVFAEQDVGFAPQNRKIHVVQCLHAIEGLADVLHLQDFFHSLTNHLLTSK